MGCLWFGPARAACSVAPVPQVGMAVRAVAIPLLLRGVMHMRRTPSQTCIFWHTAPLGKGVQAQWLKHLAVTSL